MRYWLIFAVLVLLPAGCVAIARRARACPDVVEGTKWSSPHFDYKASSAAWRRSRRTACSVSGSTLIEARFQRGQKHSRKSAG
jgi:hypothetical protein